MRSFFLYIGSALLLAACQNTPASSVVATTNSVVTGAVQAVQDGQLVCQAKNVAVAMLNTSGQAILARGASSQFVTNVCAAINAIPVPAPAPSLPTASVSS